jgi:hypothetical protein
MRQAMSIRAQLGLENATHVLTGQNRIFVTRYTAIRYNVSDSGSIPAASILVVDKAFLDNDLRLSGTRVGTRVPVFGTFGVSYWLVTVLEYLVAPVLCLTGLLMPRVPLPVRCQMNGPSKHNLVTRFRSAHAYHLPICG